MSKRFTIVVLVFVAAALIFAGCTDKTNDNPTRPIYNENGYVFSPWAPNFEAIQITTNGDLGSKGVAVYTPFGLDPNGPGSQPYPILYLLTPFQQDELYYFKHGLAAVADRLIQEGKIMPMIIVCFEGRSRAGASFYTNSLTQGLFFTAMFTDTIIANVYWNGTPGTFVGNSLITQIETKFPVLGDADTRAIGGVGVGGYGAFKAAIETGYFGSVSAINAPLDFDEGGTGGFMRLMRDNIIPGMTWPVDTAKGEALTSLMVSASAAFAPQILSFDYSDSSTTYYRDDQYGVRTFYYKAEDTLTTDLSTYLPKHHSHMPFDSTGQWINSIWSLWMAHNIDSLYINDALGHASNFTSMPKLLISSSDAEFNYDEQMSSFMQFLDGNAMPYTYETFSGTSELNGTTEHYLYDLLEDVLIFHSNHFNVPVER